MHRTPFPLPVIIFLAWAPCLNNDVIAGAAIDVYESEPATENVMFGAKNLLLTPHLGASSKEAQVNVAIDVAKTIGLASTVKLFLFNESIVGGPRENVIEGFRIGAKVNDNLNLLIPQGGVTSQYSARIVMDGSTATSEKSFNVKRRSGINSIGGNSDGKTQSVITLESAHKFINGRI